MSSSVGARSLDDDDDEDVEDVVADVDACACDDDEGDDDAAETRDLENRGVESEVPQAPPAPPPAARCMPARRGAPLLRGARARTRRADMRWRVNVEYLCGCVAVAGAISTAHFRNPNPNIQARAEVLSALP